jgi:molybdenum cofactor cytidylyltransferase
MNQSKGTFAIVILAAGESKRFGSPKQLAEFNGEPLLVSVIKKIVACNKEPYIALGANSEVISEHQAMQPFNHKIINIKEWASGLSESIKASINFLENKQLSGIVFLLGDQPLISLSYLKYFFTRVEQSPTSLVCTKYQSGQNSIGIPAYFPSEYFEELRTLVGDQGAKKVLVKNKPIVLICEDELLDVDEPEDLARAMLILD